ncbi:MAG: helix-hairpin-helix domain-containing protein, partial [Halobaculum sp.]
MELTSVPGVGAKTADALSALDDPEAALREGDVARIARAPGISEGRAAQIARGAIRARHDDPGGWAATDRASEIVDHALTLLQERAVTGYAEKRLATLYPSAVPGRISEVREWVREATDREPDPAVREALAGVEPLEPAGDVRVRDRALVAADAERYAAVDEAFPEVPVEIAEDGRELAELARSYPTVIAVDETFAGMDVEGDVRVLPDAEDRPAEIVPERPLAFLAENRDRLLAAAAVHEAAGIEPPCDVTQLRALLDRVDEDGQLVGDEELDRLRNAVDDLDAAASTAASVANDHLREAIRERDVRIEGQDFLSLIEQGARVDSLLSRELADEFDEAIDRARDHLADALALTDDERGIAERVFGGEPTFPVEFNDEPLARLRTELKTTRDRRAARLKREVAESATEIRPDAERLVRDALELDVELAIARFARDFDCTMPVFADPGIGDGASATDGGTATAEASASGDAGSTGDAGDTSGAG